MNNPTDTNQASEDELLTKVKGLNVYKAAVNMHVSYRSDQTNLPRFTGSWEREILALIRTEKLKLLNELDKSMPTAEQLTTKYGYHMPEKQYGYKLALHDIREVLTKLEAEL